MKILFSLISENLAAREYYAEFLCLVKLLIWFLFFSVFHRCRWYKTLYLFIYLSFIAYDFVIFFFFLEEP